MTDRDTFAAAALTGLLVHANDDIDEETLDTPSDIAYTAYQMADAMLRERGNRQGNLDSSNHDAAPAARASLPTADHAVRRGCESGCGTGKQTAPPCVETDGFSSSSRSGQINRSPERQSPDRECGESQLRDVPQLDNSRAAGGPGHHISEAQIDALECVVEDGRIVGMGVYGHLRSLLVMLRPEWESDRSKPISDERLAALEELSALDQELELKHGIKGNPMIKARQRTQHPHATPPQGSVSGEGSFRDSRNANEPVAWAVVYPNDEVAVIAFKQRDADELATASDRIVPLYRHPQPVAWQLVHENERLRDEIARLREAIRRLAEQDATLSVHGGSVTVTLDATLTDEEREAIKVATDFLEDEFYGCSDKCKAEHEAVATLRKLLERLA